jgi:hypothetical protein
LHYPASRHERDRLTERRGPAMKVGGQRQSVDRVVDWEHQEGGTTCG